MALYHKYRPQTLDEIIGNERTVEALNSLLKKDKCDNHAFLLTGLRGAGKTTTGRIIATMLGCKGTDYKEIDSAEFRGVDTIRDIRRQANFKPLEGKCRVFLLDEIHQLTTTAMPSLLKALEDPPEHVYYILCTTDPQKLLGTIKDRCLQFKMNALADSEMQSLLKKVVKAEEETLDNEVYEVIIDNSEGSPRAALQILEKVLNVSPKNRLKLAKQTAELESQSIEICRALLKPTNWKQIANLLKGMKDQNPDDIRRHIRYYCNSILLNGDMPQAYNILSELEEPRWGMDWPSLTLSCYEIVNGE